jgi:hypothetical protein
MDGDLKFIKVRKNGGGKIITFTTDVYGRTGITSPIGASYLQSPDRRAIKPTASNAPAGYVCGPRSLIVLLYQSFFL